MMASDCSPSQNSIAYLEAPWTKQKGDATSDKMRARLRRSWLLLNRNPARNMNAKKIEGASACVFWKRDWLMIKERLKLKPLWQNCF